MIIASEHVGRIDLLTGLHVRCGGGGSSVTEIRPVPASFALPRGRVQGRCRACNAFVFVLTTHNGGIL